VEYVAVDIDETSIETGRELLPGWLREAGYTVEEATTDGHARFEATRKDAHFTVECRVEDAFDPDADSSQFDCVIAPAVLDLVDLEPTLDSLATRLRPGGYLYAPITYDAGTRFTPGFDSDLDLAVEHAYHRHMDEVRDGGTSRAGRALLDALAERGDEVLAVGGSDWVVRPRDGVYPGDEGVVIDHVLDTMADAIPAVDHGLDPNRVDAWLADRRTQRRDGTLTYVAHHLDVLCRLGG
jgi:SAM-dependent methyltransferase